MSKFYLTDPNINILPLSDLQFRIYQYLCGQYNIKKRQAFIRIVNIAGQFQLTKDEVQVELIALSKIKHLDLPLIQIKPGNYISFDMPSHKKFLESIGFKKFSNYGWKVLNGHLKEIHTQELNKEYLYPRLDQYELREQLEDLPTEELNKIKKDQLLYPWILKDVIKDRA
tara:strand:- start:1008 stop:1517 length:510 start_codon:yes stop_codon:yes gene_type:complete